MLRPWCLGTAFALALTLGGCTRTETMPVRYRVPLAGNARGAAAARTCVATCHTANTTRETTNDNGFFACIGMCPDVEVVQDARCGGEPGESPPEALCYTRVVERETPDPSVADFLVSLVAQVAESGLRDAVIGDKSAETPSARDSEPRRAAARAPDRDAVRRPTKELGRDRVAARPRHRD